MASQSTLALAWAWALVRAPARATTRALIAAPPWARRAPARRGWTPDSPRTCRSRLVLRVDADVARREVRGEDLPPGLAGGEVAADLDLPGPEGFTCPVLGVALHGPAPVQQQDPAHLDRPAL